MLKSMLIVGSSTLMTGNASGFSRIGDSIADVKIFKTYNCTNITG